MARANKRSRIISTTFAVLIFLFAGAVYWINELISPNFDEGFADKPERTQLTCDDPAVLSYRLPKLLALNGLRTPLSAGSKFTRKDVVDIINQIVIEHLGADDTSLTEKAKLGKDLGADDLDKLEILMVLEETFATEIYRHEAENFRSVGDAVKFVMERLLECAITVTDETFEASVLKSDVPVLVHFRADWCHPCAQLSLQYDKLIRKPYFEIAEIDTDRNAGTALRYGTRGLPQLVLVQNGESIGSLTGAVPAGRLNKWIEGRLSASPIRQKMRN